MNRKLPMLLDMLGSSATTEDRLALVRLAREESHKDTCTFTLEVEEILPTHSDPEDKEFQGGTTFIGKLVDNRPESEVEHLQDQSDQQLELLLPTRWNKRVSKWKTGDVVDCSGHLHGWDTKDARYQLLATKLPKNDLPISDPDDLSLRVKVLIWAIKILIVWPIWIPCWIAYKLVYVAIPTGIVLIAIGEVTDNADLTEWGGMMLLFFIPLGLMVRLYVWAFKLRFG